MTRPHEDPIEESKRIAEAARHKKVGLKLLGGAGVHAHSPSAHKAPLKRKYGDLDYVIARRDRKAVLELFKELGYEANDRFNLMQGDRRLYFYDAHNGRQVDVFVDVFQMSHAIDLRGRLAHEHLAVQPVRSAPEQAADLRGEPQGPGRHRAAARASRGARRDRPRTGQRPPGHTVEAHRRQAQAPQVAAARAGGRPRALVRAA